MTVAISIAVWTTMLLSVGVALWTLLQAGTQPEGGCDSWEEHKLHARLDKAFCILVTVVGLGVFFFTVAKNTSGVEFYWGIGAWLIAMMYLYRLIALLKPSRFDDRFPGRLERQNRTYSS